MAITGVSAVFSGKVGDAILSADSASVFVSSGKDVVRINVTTGSEIARYHLGTTAGALDVSADGKYLAALEPDTGGKFASISLATGAVSHVDLSKLGKTTYAFRDISYIGNDALLFSQTSGPVIRYNYTTDSLSAVISSAKMASLISSDDHSHTYVIDSSYFHLTAIYGDGTGVQAILTENPDPYGGASLPTVMRPVGAITRDGSNVFEGDGGYLRDGGLVQLSRFSQFGISYSGYAFSPSGSELYSIGQDGNLIAWDTASGGMKAVYFVDALLKPDDAQFGAEPATQLGNVLQITDDGHFALAITATGIARYDLQKVVPMSTEGDDVITRGNTLYGFGGNDILGGPGAQVMFGGAGNDTYRVDAGDRVIEDANSGTDLVRTALGTFFLPDNVENLTSTAASGVTTYLSGNALGNTIRGGAGNDTINGYGGVDVLVGGSGTDTLSFLGQSAGGVTISLAIRTAQTIPDGGSVTISGFENLTGTSFDDVLTGNRGNNTLEGWAGKDLLDGGAGADHMDGGNDDDVYIVDNVGDVVSESTGNGIDTVRASVSYVLPGGIENLELTGTRNLTGTGNTADNRITGNGGDNRLDGGDGKDTLLGGGGNDTFIGSDSDVYVHIGYADDTLDGGAGNDTASYAAAYGGVTVSLKITGPQDTGSAGNDTLISIENLVGSAFADTLTGSDVANRLDGGAGDDLLSGGGGNDVLVGGRGNDTASYADATKAVTIDLALAGPQATGGAGTDTLSGIENLIGGSGSDTLAGNGIANRLEGGAGIDRLEGRGGNDWLDGGIGQDTMIGGSGNDTYVVDNKFDTVSETLSGAASDTADAGGRDTVMASVSFSLAEGGARFVENLILTGTDNIDATGNDLANVLTGNGGANRLDGGKGADILRGGAGDDIYVVDSVKDIVDERITGSEADSGGHDRIEASVSYSLASAGTAFVEDLTLTGAANLDATGNALDNRLTGNAGDNVLIGGAGRDDLSGGAGADHFVWAAASDFGGKTNTSADVIRDFSHAEGDRIDLSGVDANAKTVGSDEAFTFIGTAAFSGLAGELRTTQSGNETWLMGDTNGDKSADFMIVLSGLVSLTAGDLVL